MTAELGLSVGSTEGQTGAQGQAGPLHWGHYSGASVGSVVHRGHCLGAQCSVVHRGHCSGAQVGNPLCGSLSGSMEGTTQRAPPEMTQICRADSLCLSVSSLQGLQASEATGSETSLNPLT